MVAECTMSNSHLYDFLIGTTPGVSSYKENEETSSNDSSKKKSMWNLV